MPPARRVAVLGRVLTISQDGAGAGVPAGPALVRRMVNIQDNCGVCVRRVEFELGEVGVGVLRVEAPQDVIVLVRTERA